MLSSGRDCQALASSITVSVTVEISVGDTSVPYISSRCGWISRTVMPRAYSDRILSSKSVQRVWCLGINCGSKVPWRSRGISIGSTPNLPLSVSPALPVARITGRVLHWLVLAVAEIVGHLRFQHFLDQQLGELLGQALLANQVFLFHSLKTLFHIQSPWWWDWTLN